MERIDVEKTASRGVAVAPVYRYLEPDFSPDGGLIAADQAGTECEKFSKAKEAVQKELELLAKENPIFAAHLEIAGDLDRKSVV